MARIAGRIGRLYVSSDGGSTFSLLGCVVDATLNGNQDELETSCHESGQFREYITGRKDATIDATLHWDEADAGQNIVENSFFGGTTIVARFRMEEGSGLKEYEANAIVTNWSPTSPNDDVADVDVTLRLSGDFTGSTQA